ncbi:hypothetical protein BCR36DRAFT_444988 [Piromyces finnis]|uniref:Uncharacterized protein n=1 Tax=Piromyces finnis TaxID=1754191 RepID=A0A1Y1UEP2_9FUNG|nr:hypothetical protein BCR36DRAFT_444988 [Piromyces finnis]|eukprot:ORX36530.1 hypothetical protein BCR36DRAFT_444988 [Piromyces finnis]
MLKLMLRFQKTQIFMVLVKLLILSVENPNNTTTTIFSRDCPCTPKENLYGAHPYYMEVRNNEPMLLLNSHGLDVKLSPENLSYCILVEVLNFMYSVDQIQLMSVVQYTSFIGKPVFPPYWSLGFHQCNLL